jgi:Sugar (and other) transporter
MTSADLPAHIEAERVSDFNRAYVFAISITAALGGLMFGYDWVVIGGAEPFYEKYFHLESAFQIGWAMSSALIGALFGATSAGVLSFKRQVRTQTHIACLRAAVRSHLHRDRPCDPFRLVCNKQASEGPSAWRQICLRSRKLRPPAT